MIADMVGFSRRMEQDEAGSAGRVARSIQLFRGLIGDYGGHVANIAGDGILALFDSAEKALRFAIQIQTEFRDQSVWGDGEPIQFRIGLNIGEVTLRESIAYGHCINVAARLQTIAEPSGILVTGAFRSAVSDAPGTTLRSLGQPRLRNISEPIEVFAVERSGAKPLQPADAVREGPLAEPVRHPTIAVLALANLSDDPRNNHLCEGIAEDIIVSLSRFRNLMVIARHSSFLFSLNANPAQEVRRELGVRYILSGSLRRADKRLRIALQLIDAASENVLWSDRFKLELEDLFDLQEEIAGAVAARLSVHIDMAERRQESYYPSDMRAYGLVVRGQHLVLKCAKEANWHARRLFEEAIDIAPEYSRAHSAMSKTYNHDWRYSWSDDAERIARVGDHLRAPRQGARPPRRARLRRDWATRGSTANSMTRRSSNTRRLCPSTRTIATSWSNTATRSSMPSSRNGRLNCCTRPCGSIPTVRTGTSGASPTPTTRWAGPRT